MQLDFFQKFLNLEKLVLNGDFFSLQCLANLKKLKFLSLSSLNVLVSLDFVKEISSLIILKLNVDIIGQDTFVEEVKPIDEDTFRKLNKLEHLAIHAQPGSWMRHLRNLKSLELLDMGNYLNVDYYGSYLISLEKLQINQIKFIDNQVLKVRALNGLSELKVLNLNFTIRQIDDSFEGLENLTELCLFFDDKYSLKSSLFQNLYSLRKLSIYGAKTIDDDILENSPNLLYLYVKGSARFELTEKTFSKQRDLKELHICDCNVTNLPENVFSGLSKLKQLSFNENNLQTLNKSSFNGLENLRKLDLKGNNGLVEFNMNILANMPKLKYLYVPKVIFTVLFKTQCDNLKIDVDYL